MKLVYLKVLIVGFLPCMCAHAQTLERSVISTSGAFYSGNRYQLSETSGEIMITTFTPDVADAYTLTQGFQQPVVKIAVDSAPDLFTVNAAAVPSILLPGDSTDISCTIINLGALSTHTNFEVQYFLSSDQTYDSTDLPLSKLIQVDTLQSRAVFAIPKTKYRIPAKTIPGKWYILVWADVNQNVNEINRFNNTAIIPIELSILPDLNLNVPAISAPVIYGGDSMAIAVTVRNSGNARTSSTCYLGVLLSKNETYEKGDVLLGDSLVMPMLDSGKTHNLISTRYTIPANTLPGKYFIIFYIDEYNQINESDKSNNFATVPVEIKTHPIISLVNPTSALSGKQDLVLDINVSSVYPLDSVLFVYRRITDSTSVQVKILPGKTPFKATIPAIFLIDEIGVEYTLLAVDSARNKSALKKGTVFIRWPAPGLSIPYTSFGADQKNYRIISIPLVLDSSNVSDIFKSSLGVYDRRKWRLLNFNNSTTVENTNGLSSLEPGKGYWFIVKNNPKKPITTGPGTTVHATLEEPFSIPLKKGWNQIGNPYNFNLSWSDIKKYTKNNSQSLGSFYKWEGSWNSNDLLQTYEGAFIFAKTSDTLYFPTQKKAAAQRLGLEDRNVMNQNDWQLRLSLQAGSEEYHLGGIGMNPEASVSADALDDFTPPRFLDYLEINFDHPEFFYPGFTKDIVPTAAAYIWKFSTESALEGNKMLSWDSTYFSHENILQNGYKKLILYDSTSSQVIDMGGQGTYSFESGQSRHFSIYYGDRHFIENSIVPGSIVFGAPYPNPVTESTHISMALPAASATYQVDMVIYNSLGQKIETLAHGDFNSGFFTFTWNRRNNPSSLSSGIYVVNLRVLNGKNQTVLNRKMLLD